MEIRYKIPLFILAAFVLLSAACKKETGVAANDEPLVISYLTAGQPLTVKVYQQKGLADTTTYGPAITGQSLSVSDGSQSVKLTETTPGTYTYSTASFLVSGKTYTLSFSYLNQTVTATTKIPAAPTGYKASRTTVNVPLVTTFTPGTPDSVAIHFSWNNPDSLYHVIVFKNDDNAAYGLRPRQNPLLNFTVNAKNLAYYDLYFNSINYLGTYHATLYAVDKAYTDILTSNSNANSQQLTDPPGNITNGFGIFAGMASVNIDLLITQH